MSRKIAKTSLGMPILGGVMVARGRTVHTLLKGDYILNERQSRQMQKLFVDSAKFIGREPPKDFKMGGGEIFYEDGKIVELRLAGRLSAIKTKNYPYRAWPGWSEGRVPGFDLTGDFRLLLSPQDQGRTYVAAARTGKLFFFSWDVGSNVESHRPLPVDVDVRFIRVAAPADIPLLRNSVNEKTQFETAIHYAEQLAKSAVEMKELLIDLWHGERVATARGHQAFRHAFTTFLQQRLDAPNGSEQRYLSIKGLGEWEMKRQLLEAVLKVAREALSIRPGRRRGSKTKYRKKKVEQRNLIRKTLILRAMKAEYKKFCRKFAEADAEIKVTRVVVAERLGKKRNTLHIWLRQGEFDFEDLKTEAIRRSKIN